jgi:ATP adenylyltransferase/5',5'''-P-1,P-4-tetraphosphate phosphorylase II
MGDTHISDTHTLLLNKFNIVPHHVLVVTRDFQQQSDPLKLEDFEATWAVLQVRNHQRASSNFSFALVMLCKCLC